MVARTIFELAVTTQLAHPSGALVLSAAKVAVELMDRLQTTQEPSQVQAWAAVKEGA